MSIQDNLKNSTTWIRALFILLFWLILTLLHNVLSVVALVLFGFVLFTGQTQGTLQGIARGLSMYVYEILLFITFNSDTKPFPFSRFPSIKKDGS